MSSESQHDVVVIGAGVIGVSTAWFLAERGASVAVLDRSPRLGEDTATGSGGLITPSHCIPLGGPRVIRGLPRYLLGRDPMIFVRPRPGLGWPSYGYHTLRSAPRSRAVEGLRALRDHARESRALFGELARAGIEVGLERRGVMNVCASEEGLDALRADIALLEREGFAPRVLDRDGAIALEPALADTIRGAVYWEEDDHCIPASFTPAVGAACADRGVAFSLGSEVTGFERDGTGRVVAVLTSTGRLQAKTVVLAAGAWTPRVVRRLGAHVPIQAGTGHHVHLRGWDRLPRIPMLLHESTMGVTPMGADLRLVGGVDFVGLDRRINPDRIERIYRFVASYLREPPRPGEGQASTWCGLRPCTPDGLPIIGRLRRAPNVVLATGHGMLGLTLAPATGRETAALALGAEAPAAPYLERFSPRRFGL